MADTAQWRKTLLTLPDSSFFELMRNYLGVIQTPFNKQSLLDRLQNFLSREQTRTAVVAAIDTDDARFLSAVEFLDHPSREELFSFLSSEYTRLEIQNRLLNLQDRLLVFPDADSGELHLNPVLEPVLQQRVVRREVLFPRMHVEEPPSTEPWLTDALLAAVFSVLLEEPLAFRADGRLKRKSFKRLEEVFPSLLENEEERMAMLRGALALLGLSEEHELELHPRIEAWRDLARLSPAGRTTVVWAAAARAGLAGQSEGTGADDPTPPAADALAPRQLEARACALSHLLASMDPATALKGSHLLQLLNVALHRCGSGGAAPVIDESFIDGLCRLGVVAEVSDNRYTVPPAAAAVASAETEARAAEDRTPGVITPSYQMTLTPRADLGRSLPAVAAAHLLRYDRYCEYEINRDAVVRAFRAGFSAGEITEALESLHGGPLPQNVAFSISTWRDEYERVELLDGIVLLVEESHAPLIAHSPGLGPFIRRRLGPGAFLLSREEEPQWRAALENAGVGAVPAVKVAGPAQTAELTAPRFSEPPAVAPEKGGLEGSGASEGGGSSGREGGGSSGASEGGAGPPKHAAAEETLRDAAEEADLSEEQRREVERRIERKLIVVPEQISPALVPRETPEARGLDYVGKVRLIEQAISRGTDYLEIIERGAHGAPVRHFVRPQRVDKRSSTLLLHGETVGERREVEVRVDKISMVRVVRGILFVR